MKKEKKKFRRALLYSHLMIAVISSLILIFGKEASIASPTLTTAYALLPSSSHQEGCVAPCMCPVQIIGELEGTFNLVTLTPSPLFNRYSMNKINWTVVDSNGKIVHRIKGDGFYEVGGEVALMQQMILQLHIDGGAPVTFDSGLVPVQSQFPDISVEVLTGDTCYKVWLNINATPKY